MRKASWIGGFVLAAALASSVVPAWAETVTGEVIDMSCYLGHGETGHGASHKKCAETCAKKGLPMGLLTDDKQVFVLLEDHDNPKAYATAIGEAAQTITIDGRKVTQGGVNGLLVEDVK
jgi:hypothetical protein